MLSDCFGSQVTSLVITVCKSDGFQPKKKLGNKANFQMRVRTITFRDANITLVTHYKSNIAMNEGQEWAQTKSGPDNYFFVYWLRD